MAVKAEAAPPVSGAELRARYRAVRMRLMGPVMPAATPAELSGEAQPVGPPASADAAGASVPAQKSETQPEAVSPNARPRRDLPEWLAELVAFNEELRAQFATRRRPCLRRHDLPVPEASVRDVVAAHFGLTVAEITGQRSTRRCAGPRQIAMYICARHGGLSSTRIAALFGGRDHSTVLHAIQVVAARVAKNPVLAAEISALVDECRGGGSA